MKSLKYVLLSLIIICFYTQSYSLPRFSLRGNNLCADCHINPTGGEMRTSRGWSLERRGLPMRTTDTSFAMSNKLNDNISLGLDFRGNYLVTMQSNSTKSDFQRMQGSIYTNVQLSEEINIYAKYDFIWGIWEAYGLAKILPNGGYLKGGSFVPNYGIRLDDHTAYTRGGDLGIISSPTGGRLNRGLLYEPRYVETGGEVGIYISDFAFFTASVGESRSPLVFVTDPTYTARLQIQPTISDDVGLFFGGSFASFKTQRFDQNFNVHYPNVNMFGGFAGIGIGNLSLMGEFDVAENYLSQDSTTTAMMVEAAFKIMKGFEAVVRYDMFDDNTSLSDDEYSRLVIGVELYPYSFMQVSPQYRVQMETPKVDNDAIVVQFHLFY